MSMESLKRLGLKLDPTAYDVVFEGEVPCSDLEEVYCMFNIERPEGFTGRSLSVSDLVEVIEPGKSTFYFCDDIGFKKIIL